MKNQKKYKKIELGKGLDGVGEPLRDMSKEISEMSIDELYELELTKDNGLEVYERLNDLLDTLDEDLAVEEFDRLFALVGCLDGKIKCLMFTNSERLSYLKCGLDYFVAKLKNNFAMLLVKGDSFALDYDVGLGRVLHVEVSLEDVELVLKTRNSGKVMWEYHNGVLEFKGDIGKLFDTFFDFEHMVERLCRGVEGRFLEGL